MVMNWLRGNRYAAMILTFLRLYVGWKWTEAGWYKITGAETFSAAGYMKGAIEKPVVDRATQELIYPTYTAFLENFALPNAKLFSFLVAWGELLIGIGLLIGALTTVAMFFGLMLNFMFMFAGTISSNPWLVLLGFILLAAGANAGKFGADYYILPYLRHLFNKRQKSNVEGKDTKKHLIL